MADGIKLNPVQEHALLLPSTPGRIFTKDGHSTIKMDTTTNYGQLYLWDIWSVLLEMRWRWMLFSFSTIFLAYWLLFAILWYLLAHLNGDLDMDHNNPPQNHTMCVKYLTSFTAAFCFSLETQLTIGYGTMFPNGDCPGAVALLTVQMLLGLMMEVFITGAFVAKIARPKNKASTIRFSSLSVVQNYNGEQRFMFRIANLRKSPLVDVKVFGVIYREDKHRQLFQESVDFHLESVNMEVCPYFIFPLTFYHSITQMSPLLELLHLQEPPHFEMAIFLSVIQEGTGEVCHARTSYILKEIKQNHQFVPVLEHSSTGYKINMKTFDSVKPELPDTE